MTRRERGTRKDVAWKDEGTRKTYSNGSDLLGFGICKLDECSASPCRKPEYLDGNPTIEQKPGAGRFCTCKTAIEGTYPCDS
jgi:hypothetical protein